MPAKPLPDKTLREAVRAVRQHGSVGRAAEALGLDGGTLRHRLRAAKRRGLADDQDVTPQAHQTPSEGITQDSDGRTWSIDVRSVGVRTLEEALAVAEVDTDVWRVAAWTKNSWPVAGKRKAGDTEEVWAADLHQVRVKLERVVPEPVADAAAALAARLTPKARPKKRLPKRRHGRLVVCGLYDVHLGQLAWREETGTNDNLKLTEARVRAAIDAIVARIADEKPSRVILPFGNDFAHFDNRRAETEKGTKVDADGRYEKVVQVAHELCEYLVDRFLELGADLEVVYVQCNHSPVTSYHLCHWLAQRYRHDPRVSVDTGPGKYKFRTHGAVLLGFAHGHGIDRKRLFDVMAEHAREEWASAVCGEWHIGHFHSRQNMPPQAPSADSRSSVMIRQNPALSETSAYAHELGYAGHVPAVSAWVYDESTGYCGEMFEALPANEVKG